MGTKVTEFLQEVKEEALEPLRKKEETESMIPASIPPNEEERLEALRSLRILDTDFEKEYDDLCRLAATICETPMASISLVDRDRQWFKASVGLDVRETTRDVSFCSHAIHGGQIFEVPDTALDHRFFDNPLVTGGPLIRFYAGKPLITSEGVALGTLCTMDRVPRQLTPGQHEALDILARQVVTQLELRKALVEQQRWNTDKAQFFSIIAHDLRSPFSGLLGLVDILKDQGPLMDARELSQYVNLIHQSLHRVYTLTENLLKWALLDQGRLEFRAETVSVRALIEEAVAPFLETMERKAITLLIDTPVGLTVTGDWNMLETVLRNLLSNAIKFTPAEGRFEFRVTQTSSEVRVALKDTGTGMSPSQLALIRSGQVTGSRQGSEGEEGSGLGLTLVRQFLHRHGGRVEFDSEEGVGTQVTVVLPR